MITVEVDLGERSYPVMVGSGARDRLGEVVPKGARRAAVVTQDGIGVEVDSGLDQRTFVIGAGESAKTMATVEDLCRGFARWGLTRADVVVAVGGGVVTDTAGFAAAAYHRGVAVVHVPTTLLGMVDAAIGGKTGVNLPEGKNLVGAFWQPCAVLCDTDTLATLPEREMRSGRGEMAKYAFLGVDGLAALPMDEAVAACVACKAAHVGPDERDLSGRRALLNYGHTFAHAFETAGQYDLHHGEAVALGLVLAARLARRLGRIGDSRVRDHDDIVDSYGLSRSLPVGADPAKLVDIMSRDKKALDSLTFILDGAAGLEVVDGVDAADVVATIEELGDLSDGRPRS